MLAHPSSNFRSTPLPPLLASFFSMHHDGLHRSDLFALKKNHEPVMPCEKQKNFQMLKLLNCITKAQSKQKTNDQNVPRTTIIRERQKIKIQTIIQMTFSDGYKYLYQRLYRPKLLRIDQIHHKISISNHFSYNIRMIGTQKKKKIVKSK